MCYKSCSAWPAYGSIICPVLVIDNYWLPCSKTPVGQKVRRPGRIQQSPILYIPPPPNKVCILRYWERSCRCEVAPCYLNSKFTFHGVSTSCNGVVIAPHALILSDSRMVVTISYIKRNNWDLWSSLNQLGLDRNWRPKSTGKIGKTPALTGIASKKNRVWGPLLSLSNLILRESGEWRARNSDLWWHSEVLDSAVSGPAIFFASGMNACSLNAWIHSDSGDLSPIQVALDASPTWQSRRGNDEWVHSWSYQLFPCSILAFLASQIQIYGSNVLSWACM